MVNVPIGRREAEREGGRDHSEYNTTRRLVGRTRSAGVVGGLPVMGGGSTTVDGPKKDGMSPEVVTGVLRSPGWASAAASAARSPDAEAAAVAAVAGLDGCDASFPLYRHVSKLSTLKWWAAAAAAATAAALSLRNSCWCGWWWW